MPATKGTKTDYKRQWAQARADLRELMATAADVNARLVNPFEMVFPEDALPDEELRRVG